MDSIGYLDGANAAYIELALQRLPAGQPDVQEYHPVSRHRKLDLSLVLAWPGFPGFGKYRSHARMRHIGFQGDVRSRNRSSRRVGQFQKHRRGSDLRRLGGDCMLNRDCWRGIDRPGTLISKDGGHAGEQEKT